MRVAKTVAVFQAITQRAVNTDVIDPDYLPAIRTRAGLSNFGMSSRV
jgi:hypothetical protein